MFMSLLGRYDIILSIIFIKGWIGTKKFNDKTDFFIYSKEIFLLCE